jgi:hypothetical protein
MDLSSVSSFFSSALVFLNSKRLAIKKSWGGLLVKGDNFTVTGGDFEKVGDSCVRKTRRQFSSPGGGDCKGFVYRKRQKC